MAGGGSKEMVVMGGYSFDRDRKPIVFIIVRDLVDWMLTEVLGDPRKLSTYHFQIRGFLKLLCHKSKVIYVSNSM